MSRLQTAEGEFARRGFDHPAAAARVWGRWPDAVPRPLLEVFDGAANRDQALETLQRLAESDAGLTRRVVEEVPWLQRLVRVAGASTELARFLVRHPKEAEVLRSARPARTPEQWRAFFLERVPVTDGVAAGEADELRRANRVALLEIAARDLEADDPVAVVDAVAAELAAVADAVLDTALALARAEEPQHNRVRLAILAMGKTGAQELNYLSDVDVIHVVEPADGASADEAVAVGTRLAAAVARICSAHTSEGSIWQVDANLRPEGKAGALVRTLSGCRSYYERWAKNWEFQALLKARPAAGDLALGQEFCDLVAPMVWQAGQRDGFVAEARSMRQRVVSLVPARHAEREIKLGAGGLRDTEFSVQLLQLVHGRADERIRSRGTFEAIRQLVDTGYIGRVDGEALESAYRFQRVLEHRVQLRGLRRTHLFPEPGPELVQVARTLGLGTEEVSERWRASTRDVRRLQRRIFFSPLLEATSSIPEDGLRMSDEAAQTRMRALGFTDPRSALGHVRALTRGSSRSAEIQRQLMPAMLGWFAEGPNPDFGLLAFRQLSEALGSSSWYLRALRDEGWMAQRLARVASSSRYVVDLLRRAPEMVQMLASTDELQPLEAKALTGAMVRASERHSDPDGAAESVRGRRRAELCRVALADVLGNIDVDDVGPALSELASASVDASLTVARRELEAPPVGVVAMGSWGGREMSYASDVDLMFVVPDDTDPDGLQAAAALVRRVSELLGRPGPDPALHLDTDLRPEGRDGAPVRTVSAYASYYQAWSATWEAQALLRARAAAGTQELAQQVIDAAQDFRYPPGGLQPRDLAEIRRLKSRMENERIPRGVPRERHLKLGDGGLSDVEWTVQLLQMQHGHHLEALRTPSTLEALAVLEAENLLTPSQAHDLRSAHRHTGRLRNALVLARGRAADALPADSRELGVISELMGYAPGQSSQLVEDTRRLRRRASQVVEAVFWGK